MKRLLHLAVLAATTLGLHAYDFITSRGLRWPDGTIPMKLQLDATLEPFPFLDGKTSWNAVAQEALDRWNSELTRVQFTTSTAPGQGDGNDQNEVFFSDEIYGRRFGRLVLAVTTAWRVGSRRIEGDTIFNRDIPWNSYRGDLEFSDIDLRRVAAHEFGHTLGLDHPDRAGQVRVALMNSILSDLDDVRQDDIRGLRALYPPDTKYALQVAVAPSAGGSFTIKPTPDTNGLYQAGTIVTVTARPKPRHRFNHWDGDEVTSSRRLRVRMVDNLSLTANFSTNAAPIVRLQPRGQFASSFNQVELRSGFRRATGLQWSRDGEEIPDATNTVLVLNFVGHEHSGLYSVRATNSQGATHSKPARLVVDGY